MVNPNGGISRSTRGSKAWSKDMLPSKKHASNAAVDAALRRRTANTSAVGVNTPKILLGTKSISEKVGNTLEILWVKSLTVNEVQYDPKKLIYWQRYLMHQFSEHLRVFKLMRDWGETEGSDWSILRDWPYRRIRIPYQALEIEFAGVWIRLSPMITLEITTIDCLEIEATPYMNIMVGSTPDDSFEKFVKDLSKNFEIAKNKIYPSSTFFSAESWKIGYFTGSSMQDVVPYLHQSQHLIQIFIDSVLNAASIKKLIHLTPTSNPLVLYKN